MHSSHLLQMTTTSRSPPLPPHHSPRSAILRITIVSGWIPAARIFSSQSTRTKKGALFQPRSTTVNLASTTDSDGWVVFFLGPPLGLLSPPSLPGTVQLLTVSAATFLVFSLGWTPFLPYLAPENGATQHSAATICVKNYYTMFAKKSVETASGLWSFLALPNSQRRLAATWP